VIIHGSRKSNLIGLSFDDGPDMGEIRLISVLNEAGIRATFFWIPEKVSAFADQYPKEFTQLLDLVKKGGHEIGLHGLTCRRPNLLARFRIENQELVAEARTKLSERLSYPPNLYRPHCFRIFRTPVEMKTVLGSYQLSPDDEPAKYLLAFVKARAGDIICGHDSRDCDLNYGVATKIADFIPQIAKILATRGLKAVTVSEATKRH